MRDQRLRRRKERRSTLQRVGRTNRLIDTVGSSWSARRGCLTKEGYSTQKQAKTAAALHAAALGEQTDIYRCYHCRRWHLGRNSDRVSADQPPIVTKRRSRWREESP